MTTARPMTFPDIKHKAGCAWRIKSLAEILAVEHPTDAAGPLGDFDAEECGRLGEILGGIEVVLDLLGRTPNAHVNREALDEMQRHVLRAGEIPSEERVHDLLKRADEILGRKFGRDCIPF